MKTAKKIILIFFSSLLIIIAVLVLMNWKTIKTILILNKGKVEQKEYNIQIPFEYDLGLIFIDVTIKGVTYKFLLDSGSSNVISTDLAKKLNLQSKSKRNLEDSQRKSSEFNFTILDKISIGSLDYLNTGAAIMDLNKSDDIACLKIDGLIGANLMKKSIWKIDYQTKTIQVSDNIESFEIPTEIEKIPIFTELTGSPIIDITVNNIEEKNVIVDLGSNGGFSLSMDTYNSLISNHPAILKTTSHGLSSSVLNEDKVSQTTFYDVLTNKIFLGSIKIENAIVSFSDNSNTSTVGSEFLENYDVIIDWINYELILIKKKEFNSLNTSSYGFTYQQNNHHLIVEKLFDNSNAKKAGLKINDKIIKINDRSFDTVSTNEWCEILKNGLLPEENKNIEITILRKQEELRFNLTKEYLFKKD